jgi:hypothetical protein
VQLPEHVVSDPLYLETLFDVLDYAARHDGKTR